MSDEGGWDALRERVRGDVNIDPLVVLDPEWRSKVAKEIGVNTSALYNESVFVEVFGEDWEMWVGFAQMAQAATPPPPEPEPVWTFNWRDYA